MKLFNRNEIKEILKDRTLLVVAERCELSRGTMTSAAKGSMSKKTQRILTQYFLEQVKL